MRIPSLTPVERSILATLAYFDVFDYPLRIEELWRWLYVVEEDREVVESTTPADVEQGVRVLERDHRVERAGSYVSLRGRSQIVATRMERKVVGERKWRRARRAAWFLRFVPFVQFVGVVNTLALDNARPDSDIDFLIIVRRGRIWSTRLLVTLVVHLLGIRRHGVHVANRVCLSFYVSDARLNLELYSLDRDDTHFTFWTTQVVPLFDLNATWKKFVAENAWIQMRLPHGFSGVPAPYFGDLFLARVCRFLPVFLLSGFFGDLIEQLSRAFQILLMNKKKGSRRFDRSSDVVVSDEVMKFHELDRRREYRDAFQERLTSLGIS